MTPTNAARSYREVVAAVGGRGVWVDVRASNRPGRLMQALGDSAATSEQVDEGALAPSGADRSPDGAPHDSQAAKSEYAGEPSGEQFRVY